MAYYENKVEHFGGALVLFQRNLAVAVPNSQTHLAPTWYMRLKIGGHTGYVTKSTKLTVYEDAYEFSKSELLRLQQANRLGHSLKEYTFEQHWQDWFDRNLKNGRWKPERQNWHEKYAARYFKPYFSHADRTSCAGCCCCHWTICWPWRANFLTLMCPLGPRSLSAPPLREQSQCLAAQDAHRAAQGVQDL
jgi:hypothetical protein